uniref:ABC2_membrane_7 domain-containing protein n=1 Tax=Caenorhabditis japonica TaxID=281687 RepID=A0A8R1DTB4_CAEJA
MSDLGLMPVCDIICSRLNRSQWQRVKVAAQLARDPSILISSNIFKEVDVHDQCFLIDYLREWAVKTTLILASGRTVYYGPPGNMQQYFDSIGCPCPPYKNLCDYYVDLVTHDNLTSDASRESSVRIARLVNKWNQSAPPIRRIAGGKFILDLPKANVFIKPLLVLSFFWFEFSNYRASRIFLLFFIFCLSTFCSLFLSDLSLTLPEAFFNRNAFVEIFGFYFPLLIGLINLKKSRHQIQEMLKMTMYRCNCSTLVLTVVSTIGEIPNITVTSFMAAAPIAVFTDFHKRTPDYSTSLISLLISMLMSLFVNQLFANCFRCFSSEPLSIFFFMFLWLSVYVFTGFPVLVPSLLKYFSPLHLPTLTIFHFLYEEMD